MHGNKERGGRRYGHSIDGIISSNPKLGEITMRPRRADEAANQHLGSTHAQTEGFHPMRSGDAPVGVVAESSSAGMDYETLDEPILLDDIKPKKPKKFHKHPRLREVLKRTALILLAVIIAGGFYFGYKVYKTSRHVLAGGGNAPAVCDGNVPLSSLQTEGDSRVNILLLGIGGEGHQGADLTDTIMLASLDPVNKKLTLFSIPRDLYVKIPGYGSDRVNAAYEDGKDNSTAKDLQGQERDGIKLADQVVGDILGVPIHYNALVDFKAFEDAVNALGGVDANVPSELSAYEVFWIEGSNPAKYYTLNVKAGPNHFDGTKALYFARERHNDSDFVRGQRQRLMISAIKDKALSAGTLTNPIKISNLLNSLGNNVYTDFDSTSIKCVAREVAEVPSSDINSLDLVTEPNVLIKGFTGSDGASLQEPKAGLYDYGQIQAYVHSQLRDSFMARENSAVAVYNATTVPGMATSTADTLKQYGYNVTTVDNTPNQSNPSNTTLVDLSGGVDKYTRHYLENRFKISAVSKLPSQYGINPPQGTKFVIILGKDAQ